MPLYRKCGQKKKTTMNVYMLIPFWAYFMWIKCHELLPVVYYIDFVKLLPTVSWSLFPMILCVDSSLEPIDFQLYKPLSNSIQN